MATLTTTDLDNGKTDLETLSTVVNSQTESTTSTRLGDTVRTLKGLQDEYEQDISDFNDTADQVISDGEIAFDNAIASAGYSIVGDFSDVTKVEITADSQVYTSKSIAGFEDALWRTNQTLPYTPTGSDPTTGAELGKWVSVAQGELKGIARSLNALDSEVIYSTDTTTILNDVLYIYDASAQTVWGKPSSVGAGETIASVIGSALTTSGGSYILNAISTFNIEFNTVSLMKKCASISDGSTVMTLGYYEVGDGGAAKYAITASGSYDGFGSHLLDNGLVANILVDGTESGDSDTYTRAGRPEQFGVVVGGTDIDYKPHIDSLLSHVSVIDCYGLYHLSNLVFPNKILRFNSKGSHHSGFVANDIGGFDSEYFAAPETWLNNDLSVNQPVHNNGCRFDGGTRDIAVVAHWFSATWYNYQVLGGTSRSMLTTAINRDGSTVSSTMVNNLFLYPYVQGAEWEITDDGKTTDWQVFGGQCNAPFTAKTMAGVVISGLHVYNGDATFSKASGGTSITGCYFENNCIIQEAFGYFSFGPQNTVKLETRFDFGANATVIKSYNNKLNTVKHNYFGNRKLILEADTYDSIDPISFGNSGSGNSAEIEVTDCLIDGARWSGSLSPVDGKTGRTELNNSSDFPIESLLTDVTGASSINKSFTFRTPEVNSSLLIDIDIAKRTGGVGSTAIAASWKFALSVYSGFHGVTTTQATTLAGAFTANPAVTYVDNGDGTSTITVTATWSGLAIGLEGVTIRLAQ